LLIAVLVFALIKPDSLTYLGFAWLDTALIATDVILAVTLAGGALLGVYRPSIVSVGVGVFFATLAASTVLNSGNLAVLTQMAGPAVAACLMTDWGIQRHPNQFLSGAAIGLLALYGANLASILLYYPEGMYRTSWVQGDTYLMGFDNAMVYALVPMMMYALLRSRVALGRALGFVSIAAIVVSVVSVFYVRSGAGMVQVVVFIALVTLGRVWPLPSLFRGILPLVWLAGASLIVALRGQGIVPSWLLDALGKDSTLTNRTGLWDYALALAERNPISGVGVGEPVVSPSGHVYPHAHSLLADTVFTGGLVAVIALLMLIFIIAHRLSTGPSGPIASTIAASVFALLLGEAANSMQFKALFWATLAMAAYIPELSQRALQATSSGIPAHGQLTLPLGERITQRALG